MLNKPRCDLYARLAFSCVAATAFAACASAQTDCYYSWEEIRVNGAYAVGWAINNHGHVAGEIVTGGDNTLAFVWTPETGVGVLPFPDGVYSMAAYAINDSGQIAGIMNDGTEPLGFVWQAGVGYSVIDPPSPRGLLYVKDINNRGEVVASVYHRTIPEPARFKPFVWEAGILAILDEVSPTTNAYAGGINELGDIVGNVDDAVGAGFGYVLRNRTDLSWLPLPPGATETRANDINNTGMIVGLSVIGPSEQIVATMWSGSTITTILPAQNSLRAAFRGVNDSGRAIGDFYRGSDDRPFVVQHGNVLELVPLLEPQPAIGPDFAQAINASGQIVVTRGNRSLRLTPQWLEGDVTGDCHVGLEDLALLLVEYGAPPGSYISADVNNDGLLDLTDLAILLSRFGE